MAADISESSGAECRGDPKNSAKLDADYPLRVLYCGGRCFVVTQFFSSFQYCEYMPDVAKCRQWLEKNFPNEFAKLTVENSPKQEAGISEGQGTAGEEEEKKKQKRGGRGQIKQKKKTVPQKVTIAKIPRAKKKYVTRVCGLATFVTGEDEIIIQGDFTDDIIDVIQEKWPENIGSEVELSTIEKQRKELQLLIAELKDRDRELNDMVAVHQRQLLSWEEDRQKVLTLEERCSKLEGELHKRTEIIRSLMKKVKTLESSQVECQTTLQKTQLQLQEMAQKATHSSLLSEDLEARNENLSNTLVDLSAQVGQLQAREQALTTMIKLKDKDIIEAVNHIADCSGKFKLLEHALQDAKMAETCIVKEKQDYKQKLKALKIEVSKLKEDLNEKTTENNEQREEIIRLKQEKSCLQDELAFTAEREKRKDELLDIAKSKQERTNSELHSLRQGRCPCRDLCLSDLENSHPRVDVKREKNQRSLVKDQKFETLFVQQHKPDKSPCAARQEEQLQASAATGAPDLENSHPRVDVKREKNQRSLVKDQKFETLFVQQHKPDKSPCAARQEEQLQASAATGGEQQPSGTSAPDERQWHDLSVYLGLANCPGAKRPERPDAEGPGPAQRPAVSCSQKIEAYLGDSDACVPECCHPSNFIVEAPGQMSDFEWMSIFKPSKTQRIVRHKSVCTCAESVTGPEYDSASELIVVQHSHCVASSKSALKEDETEASSEKKNPPKDSDDFSPTRNLQCLLAKSRQVVTNLELSTLLPIGCEDLSGSAQSVRVPSVLAAAVSRLHGESSLQSKEEKPHLQAISISKAINSQEVPVKEKHARRILPARAVSRPGAERGSHEVGISARHLALTLAGIILGTHHEKGAFTFWSYAIGLPLPRSAIGWPPQRELPPRPAPPRDSTGRPHALLPTLVQVLHDCQRYRSNIREVGDLWGHLHDRYGQLVSVYTRLLLTKISFHLKHPQFPAGLEVTDEVLEKAAGAEVNNIFQLTVEMFDYMDCELKLAESVFRQLNTAIAVSQMSSGQCRLAPLIQAIQDCSPLYHYTVTLMFKLHSCLPADTLQGHRDRFHEQFHSLRNFFRRASDMLYFKRLIQVPQLPEGPPNFLRASALAEHIKPVVVIPEDTPEEEEPENLIEISTGPPAGEPAVVADLFDQTFGPPNGSVKDDRDLQIESLKREVETLRAELEKIKVEAQRYVAQLKGQVNGLEAELEQQRKQKQKALVDNEQLRHELAQLQAARLEGERHQGLREEAERRASATEARYSRLKEKHAELVSTHAELLRKNADTAKQLTVTQQSQEEVARVKEQLAFQVEQVKRESEMKLEEQSDQLEKLRRELETKDGELARVQATLSHTEQSGSELSSRLDALNAEKEALSGAVRQREADLLAAQSLVREKEAALSQEQQRGSRERSELQGRLAEKESQEQGLRQRLLDEQFAVLRGAAAEAEGILHDAVSKLDDPLHLRCTSSPDYLVSRAQAALGTVSTVEQGHAQYLASLTDASALVAALTRFSHLAADTIINGGATSHLAPTDPADRGFSGSVPQACSCGLDGVKPTPCSMSPQELKPKSLDVRQEELGAMVDKEMAATSAAIEDAVRRIEDMMNQARHASSGVKLEVNERILNSCTDLMKAIRLLVTTSTSLQKEIVDSGRVSRAACSGSIYGAEPEGQALKVTPEPWTASAWLHRESADRVVLHTGKYEELIVCSHEIAASTAQLVAASKVKADKHSRHLSRLQECSRTVNEMAANVVASTKSGQEQIEDKDTMDFSGLSLIKLKKQEMETQVRVLELEKTLEAERVRLGGLRRQHYELAGATCVPGEEEASRPGAAPRGGTKKPPLAQKPSVAPRPDHQLDKKDGVYAAQLVDY
ncbi:Huntingtin-interacting protein 1-related protein [Tupaia chinensis]|uniref:Huntingtin-interacting protein 1-related protein n=1 Tax=Tupaia chinensis TaxID=246437 RepID=L9KRW2_TUPCH|nr:Huntingtin-interacting protein 1-related protein [Tupaia chinensis]